MNKELISGYIIERTAKRLKQSFAKLLVEADAMVTVDQWVVIEQLSLEDEISQLEIAKRTYKDAPTVTRIIDLLVNKQLVQRLPDPDDRRKFKIILTKKGQKEASMVYQLAMNFRKQIYKGLSKKEVLELERMMDLINDNVILMDNLTIGKQ